MSKSYFRQIRQAHAPASASRPKEVPSTTKKTVSINPLLSYSKALKRSRDYGDDEEEEEEEVILQPLSPNLRSIVQPELSRHYGQAKKLKVTPKPAQLRPTIVSRPVTDKSSLSGAGGAYQRFGQAQEAAEAALRHRLSIELEARQDGLDALGKPLQRAHVPTEEEIAQLEAEIAKVDLDVNDETIAIGNGKHTRIIRIGDALDLYQKCQERAAPKIQQYTKELRKVEKELAMAVKLLEGDSPTLQEAERQLQEKMEAFEKEKQRAERRAKKDLEKLAKEVKAKGGKFNRDIQELIDGYK